MKDFKVTVSMSPSESAFKSHVYHIRDIMQISAPSVMAPNVQPQARVITEFLVLTPKKVFEFVPMDKCIID
jgi:hypothetical protein